MIKLVLIWLHLVSIPIYVNIKTNTCKKYKKSDRGKESKGEA